MKTDLATDERRARIYAWQRECQYCGEPIDHTRPEQVFWVNTLTYCSERCRRLAYGRPYTERDARPPRRDEHQSQRRLASDLDGEASEDEARREPDAAPATTLAERAEDWHTDYRRRVGHERSKW